MRANSAHNSKKKLFVLIFIILLVAGAAFYWKQHNDKQIGHAEDVNSETIRQRTGSKDLNDQRVLINAYIAQQNFDKAKEIAISVANTSKSYQDYLSLLNLCTLYGVTDKETCIRDTIPSLKSQVTKMPFISAYSAGGLLEKDGKKTDAVVFYQRAYDTYDPAMVGEGMMSKDKLKAHIDELSK